MHVEKSQSTCDTSSRVVIGTRRRSSTAVGWRVGRECRAVARLQVTKHRLRAVFRAPVAVKDVTALRRRAQWPPVHERRQPALEPPRCRHHVDARSTQRKHVSHQKKQRFWYSAGCRRAEHNRTTALHAFVVLQIASYRA